MKDTKEKHAHTPGPWVTSCIEGVEDSLMVGGGDDGSDIVADIRTHENDILDAQAELYDDIPAMLSRAHVHGDCTEKIDKLEKEAVEKLAELERKEKEAKANARLIAAAPDLLQQCKLYEKVLSELVVMGEADIEDRDKVREVLAKVEGGEG
tara:strand:- start:726 stop:1181 length:456 start_codon:yes stop_codon:yes gene_type:complete